MLAVTLSAGFCLFYLDQYFFRLSVGWSVNWRLIFMPDWAAIYFFLLPFFPRFVMAFIAGVVLYNILNRNVLFLVITWVIWQMLIYFAYVDWQLAYSFQDEAMLWFAKDMDNVALRLATAIPYLAGVFICRRLIFLQKIFSTHLAKLVVTGLSLIALELTALPFAYLFSYNSYHAARRLLLPTPEGAHVLRDGGWNARWASHIIMFKSEPMIPDSLISFYNRQLQGWRSWPGQSREWQKIDDYLKKEYRIADYSGYMQAVWVHPINNVSVNVIIFAVASDSAGVCSTIVHSIPAPDWESIMEMERRNQEQIEKFRDGIRRNKEQIEEFREDEPEEIQ